MIPRFESLLDDLARLLARALGLGPEGATTLARLVTIVTTAILGWIAYRLVTGLIHRVLRPVEGAPNYTARIQRARTLDPLLANVTKYVVAFIVGMVALQELGIDVRALMVSAGVVGLAISLGAQGLIKDIITGFSLLFEGLIVVGDVVEVGPHLGVVESVGLRITKIRKFTGELRIVPNSDLTAFGHHTAGWGRALVEVGIPRDRDVDDVLSVLEAVGRAFREAHRDRVLEPPVAEGIVRFGENEMVLRLHARVDAAERSALELELRRRVKEALEAAGIWSIQRKKESPA
ncbi:MAG TPA: mechanosensitive ion channel family protein [Methylomirabilota bacterium]|nr:mechanosensitive ion channel family protein [Methylomirabilota bacterium]